MTSFSAEGSIGQFNSIGTTKGYNLIEILELFKGILIDWETCIYMYTYALNLKRVIKYLDLRGLSILPRIDNL